MGTRAGSTIGAFLLSIPVSAILLMAIFGIPRLAPGVGGDGNWQDPRQLFANLTGRSSNGSDVFDQYHSGAGQPATEDPFGRGAPDRQMGGGAVASAPRWGESQAVDRGAPPIRREMEAGASEWPFSRTDARPSATGEGGRPNASPMAESLLASRGGAGADPSRGGAQITWGDARRQLAEWGISDFHLEPGLDGDSYLFVCTFSPGDDPRVTHRFEAETSDPLTAVASVLNQIDGWLQQRHAARSQQIIEPFSSR